MSFISFCSEFFLKVSNTRRKRVCLKKDVSGYPFKHPTLITQAKCIVTHEYVISRIFYFLAYYFACVAPFMYTLCLLFKYRINSVIHHNSWFSFFLRKFLFIPWMQVIARSINIRTKNISDYFASPNISFLV